ncbi:MAG: hypothetical protein GDA56_09930 [Hormoscilla sp. GM7CHS1pb]|nr:hypothetical protein [Hormoscilla sp. GM7CHS1pb]
MSDDRRIATALLLLRLSVFLVMLVWTLIKFVQPERAARIFEKFYFLGGFGNIAIYVVGVVQLAIIIGFAIGFQKRWTYLAVLFLHAVSTFSSYKQYLAPYQDSNILFFAAWPMLAACFTLYYLRDLDTKWVISSR